MKLMKTRRWPRASAAARGLQGEAVVVEKAPVPARPPTTRRGRPTQRPDPAPLRASPASPTYRVPANPNPDDPEEYNRLLDKAKLDVARGIVKGNILAYAGLDPTKTADLVVAAFEQVPPDTMKGVRVVYIGDAANNGRVKAAVEPAGVDYVFVEPANPVAPAGGRDPLPWRRGAVHGPVPGRQAGGLRGPGTPFARRMRTPSRWWNGRAASAYNARMALKINSSASTATSASRCPNWRSRRAKRSTSSIRRCAPSVGIDEPQCVAVRPVECIDPDPPPRNRSCRPLRRLQESA